MSPVTCPGNRVDIATTGRETCVHVSHLALEKLGEEGRERGRGKREREGERKRGRGGERERGRGGEGERGREGEGERGRGGEGREGGRERGGERERGRSEGMREGGGRSLGRLDAAAINESLTYVHIRNVVFALYLKVPNLGSKLLPDMHVWECDIHARLHDSDGTSREDKTLIVQPTHEYIHSLPYSTHHILSCV